MGSWKDQRNLTGRQCPSGDRDGQVKIKGKNRATDKKEKFENGMESGLVFRYRPFHQNWTGQFQFYSLFSIKSLSKACNPGCSCARTCDVCRQTLDTTNTTGQRRKWRESCCTRQRRAGVYSRENDAWRRPKKRGNISISPHKNRKKLFCWLGSLLKGRKTSFVSVKNIAITYKWC